jgi:hypothetical protein
MNYDQGAVEDRAPGDKVSPERRGAFLTMSERIRGALLVAGIPEATDSNSGFSIRLGQDKPDRYIVVIWADAEGDDSPEAVYRQREQLAPMLWLITDNVDGISGIHLDAWGEPAIVIDYADFDPQFDPIFR